MSASALNALKVCQFNVLAPSARICAPLDSVPWQKRHEAICQELLRIAPDIICLQEFDFSPRTPGFKELYDKHLHEKYSVHLKQRTRGKPEGLAIFLSNEIFSDISVEAIDIQPSYCDRVLQVASAVHQPSGRRIQVANTHLTVAHASNNHDIPSARPTQMQEVLDRVCKRKGFDVTLICADMNCDHLETENPEHYPGCPKYTAADVALPVQMTFNQGFHSALHDCTPQGVRPISHTSSYSQDGCVDYVFFRPEELELRTAVLLPEDVAIHTEWSSSAGWGQGLETLSDHRPLLTEFEIGPPRSTCEEGGKGDDERLGAVSPLRGG